MYEQTNKTVQKKELSNKSIKYFMSTSTLSWKSFTFLDKNKNSFQTKSATGMPDEKKIVFSRSTCGSGRLCPAMLLQYNPSPLLARWREKSVLRPALRTSGFETKAIKFLDEQGDTEWARQFLDKKHVWLANKKRVEEARFSRQKPIPYNICIIQYSTEGGVPYNTTSRSDWVSI